VAVALTTSIAAGAAGVSASAVTLSAPHTLYISVANGYLTMPHRIAAGQYYFQVRTRDTNTVVQIVRAPTGYTPRQFLDARTRYVTALRAKADPRAAFTAWVKSVTFVGGVAVARGGVGAFATGLRAGTYWLYGNATGGPTHLARIAVLSVVGAFPAQTPVSSVGVVRFGDRGAPTMPANLPTAGWLKGLGGTAPLNSLTMVKLAPGVTTADLDGFGVCFGKSPFPPTKECFESPGMHPSGYVSAGASVFWYYRLPRGDYIAGNMGPSALFNIPFWDGVYTRFRVS